MRKRRTDCKTIYTRKSFFFSRSQARAWERTLWKLCFAQLKSERVKIGDVSVESFPLNHPQGAYGYKIISEAGVIVYASDREHGNDDSDHKLREVATPSMIELSELPAALRERYVGASGKWLLRVFAKDCLWDFEPLEHFTKQIHTVDPGATGKPFSTVVV